MSLSSAGSLPSDHELLWRIREQDEDALSVLYDRYANLVYSFALHVVQSPSLAEEVTQDTFIKIWYRADGWNPAQGKFSSWLLTVTRYTAIDRLRKEHRQFLHREVSLNIVADDPSRDTRQLDDGEIRALIGQLPVEQVQAIEYAFFHGMTHREIADALQLPLGTVKTRLRLGLMKLRELCLHTLGQEVS